MAIWCDEASSRSELVLTVCVSDLRSAGQNGARTAKSESRSPVLNDVNEEMDGLQVSGTQANQIGASLKAVNLCMHGLVLPQAMMDVLSIS